jgi:DNA polymerase-1
MTRAQDIGNLHDPALVAVDYTVSGPRTAAAVVAGRANLESMTYQTAEDGLQTVPPDQIPGVLHSLGDRPRLYNHALLGLAVEAVHEFPSPFAFDDNETMLRLIYGQRAEVDNDTSPSRSSYINDLIQRVQNPLALGIRLSEAIACGGLDKVYHEVELPVLAPTLAMTLAGIRVNTSLAEGIREARDSRLNIARRQLLEIAGRPINMDSAFELTHFIHGQLHLPVVTPTKNGSPSISIAALEPLADQHPAIPVILSYMEHRPVRDAAAALLAHAGSSGLIYPNLDSLGAVTGRFSCSEPNLQGLAVPLRAAIEAAPGCVLLEADYSQMELRVLTHFCQDSALLHAFYNGIDLHTRTAASVLGISEDAITEEQRKLGKTLNFGIVYGQTAYGLADELGVPLTRAEELLAAHAAAYPRIGSWSAIVFQRLYNRGEVHTLYGRRRHLPNIYSTEQGAAAEAQRNAINTVIQGTAADLLKLALIRLHDRLPNDVRILLSVHDSVLLEVPQHRAEEIGQMVREAMETRPAGFTVPLKVNVHAGRRWADCN